jgi:hypothetical protein
VMEGSPRIALYPLEKPKGLYTRRITRTKPLAGFWDSVDEDDMFELIAVGPDQVVWRSVLTESRWLIGIG